MTTPTNKDGVITITEQHLCRRFNDLSDDDKQRVIARYGDYTTEGKWWDVVYDGFKEDMESHGIDVDLDKTYFRGFYSQGDGAAFEASVPYPEEFIRDEVPEVYKAEIQVLLDAMRMQAIELEFSIGNASTHYYNQRAEITITCDDWMSAENAAACEKSCAELSDWLNEFCKEKAWELYRELEKEYDYLTSVEAYAEAFDANDCVFEIGSGIMFHYEGE